MNTLRTNHQNYAKRIRQLTRLMDMADSGIECTSKIRVLSKSIGKFEDTHYPIHYKRRRLSNGLKQYTIDNDTWLARHNQPLSPMRSPRALKARVETTLKKCNCTPDEYDKPKTAQANENNKTSLFIVIRKNLPATKELNDSSACQGARRD